MKLYLVLTCIALLGVIAAQDDLVPALRNETISRGLSGPYHWYLDAAYLLLAIAIVGASSGFFMRLFAVLAALALVATAFTNTFATLVDKWTAGQHSLWHTRATIAVFVAAFLVELTGDQSTLRVALTVLTVAAPAIAYLWFEYRPTTIQGVTVAASPAAEKLYVTGLCLWFIAWAL